MNLLGIRQQFINLSGRYDLATTATDSWDTDAGADFFIQAGQKYLDKLVATPESIAQLFLPLGVGEYSLTFQNHCRSVKDVFINTSSARSKLTKVNLTDLKECYDEVVGETSNAAPNFYALANLRALETTVKTDLGTFINLTWNETDTKYDYRGIIIVPPAVEAATVEISGLFSQNTLSVNTDTNYWATEYPHLLVMAALRAVEVFNRNTEGMNDWSNALKTECFELELDVVEEEIYDVSNMEG